MQSSEKYMRQALRLAEKGAGFVAPNPMVGAVIVKTGKMIGQGYHKRFGNPHAEVEALADCQRRGNDPAGAEMFVTLEPCCHYGKTGPCTLAIQQAGISKVSVATQDECKLVDGKGITWLRQQGIEVDTGCCQEEARRLNAGFFKLQRTGQPRVILKWAQSLDGKLAWPDSSDQRWLSGELARCHVHQQRARCGAILVGSQTVLDDDPQLTVRMTETGPDETANSSRKSLSKTMFRPLRVVLDGRLRLSTECRLARSAHEAGVLICTSTVALRQHEAKALALRELDCQVEAFAENGGHLDLPCVLQELGRRGVTDLLVEGGPTILNAFLSQNLAGSVMVYVTPLLIGGEHTPGLHLNEIKQRLHSVRTTSFGEDVLIEGDLPAF